MIDLAALAPPSPLDALIDAIRARLGKKPRNYVVVVHRREGRVIAAHRSYNLRTNAGTDWSKQQLSGTVAGSATFIAVTANAVAAAAADTTLTAEETLNGLIRAAGTVAMGAAGTTTITVTKLMTYTGGAPITLAKTGLFSALTGGTMVFEALYGTAASLVNGDQLTSQWSVQI